MKDQLVVWVAEEESRLRKVVSKILSNFSSYEAKQASRQLLKGDDLGFSQHMFVPSLCKSASEASEILFLTELFSKAKLLRCFEQDPDERGIQKFTECELNCLKSNYKLTRNNFKLSISDNDYSLTNIRSFRAKGSIHRTTFNSYELEYYIRTEIRKILDVSVHSSEYTFGWGKGTTSTIKGTNYTKASKLAEYPFCISEHLWKDHSNLISGFYGYLSKIVNISLDGPVCLLSDSYRFLEVANITTVPKTNKTSRPISIEPTCNVSMTLHEGEILRKKLAKCGIDLTDQGTNQELAKYGVQLGLATVDLSSASDNMSLGVLNRLLPETYFNHIMKYRTNSYTLPNDQNKQPLHTNKFAGMGNGLTFPLQTLLFYGIAKGLCTYVGNEEVVSCYGDDIILPDYLVPALIDILHSYGLKVNKEKTHYQPFNKFRESCGVQVFDNVDVTPPYIKNVGTNLASCIRNHNRLYRWLIHNNRLDLLPLLGSLRIKGCPSRVVEYNIPETDNFFFLFRGNNYGRALSFAPQYRRGKVEDFYLLTLLNSSNQQKWDQRLYNALILANTGEAELLGSREREKTYKYTKNGIFIWAVRDMNK